MFGTPIYNNTTLLPNAVSSPYGLPSAPCGYQVLPVSYVPVAYPQVPQFVNFCSSPPTTQEVHFQQNFVPVMQPPSPPPVQLQMPSCPPSPNLLPVTSSPMQLSQPSSPSFLVVQPPSPLQHACPSPLLHPIQAQVYQQPQEVHCYTSGGLDQSYVEPCFLVGDNCGPGSKASSSDSSERTCFSRLYQFEIILQKESVEEVKRKYADGILLAMERALGVGPLDMTLSVFRKNKALTLEWVLKDACNPNYVQEQTKRKDFEKTLICELSKIDGGSFNTYINRAKQLSIIEQGWASLLRLQGSIVSSNCGDLDKLLTAPKVDRFDEELTDLLYKLCVAPEGQALRGPTVAGIRFKLQPDILKMPEFIELVQAHYHIRASALIASLKTRKQYKGWSLYLDVGSEENVEGVKQLASDLGFQRSYVFTAEDRK